MAKMADLHAEGVTDLYSYTQGKVDALQSVSDEARKLMYELKVEMDAHSEEHHIQALSLSAQILGVSTLLSRITEVITSSRRTL